MRVFWFWTWVGLIGVGAMQWGLRYGPSAVSVPADLCLVAPATPHDPASGRGVWEAREVPPEARCPVCGMFPARSRAWAAQIIFRDGDAHFFDSPLSLFLYLQDVGRYSRGRRASDIAVSFVSDARSGRWIDARQAWYVHGSDAMGPMRSGNLPAFASPQAAAHFAQQRGGQVMSAAALSQALPPELQRLAPHAH